MNTTDLTARAEELAQEFERHDRAMTQGQLTCCREIGADPKIYAGPRAVAVAHVAADSYGFVAIRNAAPEIATVLRALVAEIRLTRPVVAEAESYVDEYGPLNAADRKRYLLCLAVDAMRAQRGGQ